MRPTRPTNLAVLRGELSSPPEIRLLDSGTRLAALQVRVATPSRPATSVPVTLWDPPDAVETMEEGDAVAVLGSVERRFFARAGGGTGSAVCVVASAVIPAGDRRRLRALLRRAEAALAGWLEG